MTEYTHGGSYIRSHYSSSCHKAAMCPQWFCHTACAVTIVTCHTHCQHPTVVPLFEQLRLIEISQNEMELDTTVVLIPRSFLRHERLSFSNIRLHRLYS